MTTLHDFERWALHARREAVPTAHVARGVLQAISDRASRAPIFDSYALGITCCSLVLAAVMTILAVHSWEAPRELMLSLYNPLSLVLR